jgi:hypothetical protein
MAVVGARYLALFESLRADRTAAEAQT